jgi:CheY-like chemotaxis protein
LQLLIYDIFPNRLESLHSKNIFASNNQERNDARRLVPNHGRKVLIVDDEPDVTLILKIGLETNGYVVDAVNDPVEGLLYFQNNRYDFLILDIRMPHINGFEFYTKIQNMNSNSALKTKVCFLTALSLVEDCNAPIGEFSLDSITQLATEKDGQNIPFILTKPVSIAILCRLIDEMLSDSRLTTVAIKQDGQLQEPPKCAYCGALMDCLQKVHGRTIMIDGKMYFCNNPICMPVCA